MAEGYWHPGGWWLGMGIMTIVFWALVVVGIIYLVRWMATGTRAAGVPKQETALEALDKRYARGEITREQYLEMRDQLERKQ